MMMYLVCISMKGKRQSMLLVIDVPLYQQRVICACCKAVIDFAIVGGI